MYMLLTVKRLLLKIFKRKNIFIIFLVILKQSFWAIRQIKRVSFKYSIILIPKIIYGYYFYNKEINSFKKEDINTFFNSKYKFDYDSDFTTYFLFWKNIINKISKIKYLEIGSFEGRSASFIKELSNLESLIAVDTFEGSDELKNIDYKKVYENFKYNLNLEGAGNANINFMKDNSDNFFNKNKSYYNLIYIDGSHHYEQVKKDFINSFNFLENNGYIICDDFMWFYYDKIELNPMKAILDCYELYKDRLSIEFVNYQIIFKKIT